MQSQMNYAERRSICDRRYAVFRNNNTAEAIIAELDKIHTNDYTLLIDSEIYKKKYGVEIFKYLYKRFTIHSINANGINANGMNADGMNADIRNMDMLHSDSIYFNAVSYENIELINYITDIYNIIPEMLSENDWRILEYAETLDMLQYLNKKFKIYEWDLSDSMHSIFSVMLKYIDVSQFMYIIHNIAGCTYETLINNNYFINRVCEQDGNINILKYILNEYDIPIDIICRAVKAIYQQCNIICVEYLWQRYPIKQYAFTCACERGDIELVRYMLANAIIADIEFPYLMSLRN